MKIRFPLGKAGDSHYKILLKIIIILLVIYFWLAGSLLLGGLFSSCSKWGLLSRCGVRAFRCGGCSCCRAGAPRCIWASVVAVPRLSSTGSIVSTHGLSYSEACGIFLNQGWSPFPALAGGFLTTEPPGKPSFQRMFFKRTEVHSDIRRRRPHTPHSGLFQDSTSLNMRG